MKKLSLFILVVILLTACQETSDSDSDNVDSTETVVPEGVAQDEGDLAEEDADALEDEASQQLQPAEEQSEIQRQIDFLNSYIDSIALPQSMDSYRNKSSATAIIYPNQDFELFLRLEETAANVERGQGIPFNIRVTTYSDEKFNEYKDQNFELFNQYGKEFLVNPSEDVAEIIYRDRDYLYQLDSRVTVMNTLIPVYTTEELIDKSEEFRSDSPYKDYFIIDPTAYTLPTYMTDEQNLSSVWVMCEGYDSNEYETENQELSIGNDSVHIKQSLATQYQAEQLLEQGASESSKELTISDTTGYLDLYETNGFAFEKDGYQFYVSPATEVNENTGKPYSKEIPNWGEEVRKIVEGILSYR